MNVSSQRSVMIVVGLLGVGMVSHSRAGVAAMRKLMLEEESLMHLYAFEGPHQPPRSLTNKTSTAFFLKDWKGDADLVEWATSSPVPKTYGPGFDGWSRAGSSYGDQEATGHSRGNAWHTTTNAPISLPSEVTSESLFRVDGIPDKYGSYLVANRTDSPSLRSYLLVFNSQGKLGVQIGTAGAVNFSEPLQVGHWYYVATTFAVADNKTTVNAYLADLTTGEPLTQLLDNHVINSYYSNTPMSMGIGCFRTTGSSQYPASVTFDEVGIYGSVLSFETMRKHLKALRQEEVPHEVVYREIFPNVLSTDWKLENEGWRCHSGEGGVAHGNAFITYGVTAFEEVLEPVNSFPSVDGPQKGYINNLTSPSETNIIYWTEEMTNQVKFSWLRTVEYDASFVRAQEAHVVVRLDVNNTPATTGDDLWFIARDFAHPAGTSVPMMPQNNVWWRFTLDMNFAEWTSLDFVPGERIALGTEQVIPPPAALVTGFGLYHPFHENVKNARVDNYTLYVAPGWQAKRKMVITLE